MLTPTKSAFSLIIKIDASGSYLQREQCLGFEHRILRSQDTRSKHSAPTQKLLTDVKSKIQLTLDQSTFELDAH